MLKDIKTLTAEGYGSRSKIMRHLAIGGFKAFNPGGKWMIDVDSYEKWLAETTNLRRKHRW